MEKKLPSGGLFLEPLQKYSEKQIHIIVELVIREY